MPDQDWWSRIREARMVRLLAVYLAASWAILQVTDLFIERFGVPEWVAPTALVLLMAGLLVLLATAWVQSHPLTPKRAEAEEVPSGCGLIAFLLLFGFAGLYVVIKDRGQSFSPDEALAEGAALARMGFRPRS